MLVLLTTALAITDFTLIITVLIEYLPMNICGLQDAANEAIKVSTLNHTWLHEVQYPEEVKTPPVSLADGVKGAAVTVGCVLLTVMFMWYR